MTIEYRTNTDYLAADARENNETKKGLQDVEDAIARMESPKEKAQATQDLNRLKELLARGKDLLKGEDSAFADTSAKAMASEEASADEEEEKNEIDQFKKDLLGFCADIQRGIALANYKPKDSDEDMRKRGSTLPDPEEYYEYRIQKNKYKKVLSVYTLLADKLSLVSVLAQGEDHSALRKAIDDLI